MVSAKEAIAEDSTGILSEGLLEGYAEFYSVETKIQLEISMAQAKLKKPLLSKKQILFWLYRFRGIDTSKPDQRQRLIDSEEAGKRFCSAPLDGTPGQAQGLADLAVCQIQHQAQNQNALLLLRQTGKRA